MMHFDEQRIAQAVRPLIGRALFAANRAANMDSFQFGTPRQEPSTTTPITSGRLTVLMRGDVDHALALSLRDGLARRATARSVRVRLPQVRLGRLR